MFRPVDSLRTQGVYTTNDIEQIPARVTVFPFALVRIEKITIQTVPSDFIIKTNAVVTCHTGIRHTKNLVNAAYKLVFNHAFTLTFLRSDTGNQNRSEERRVGKECRCRGSQ